MPKLIHIASSAVADSLILKRLKQDTFIQDESYLSLSVLLNNLHPVDQHSEWMRLALFLEGYQDPYHRLDSMLKYPKTVDQVMSFINRFYDEGYSLDDLPTHTPKEQALKQLMAEVLPLFNQRSLQWQALLNSDAPSAICVEPGRFSYGAKQHLNTLIEKGAQTSAPPRYTPKLSVRYAPNPRLEAQAIVQDIVLSNIDPESVLVICCDTHQLNYLNYAFQKAFLSVHGIHQSLSHPSHQLMRSLIQTAREPSHANLLKLLNHPMLNHEAHQDLVDYIRLFEFDLDELLNQQGHVSQHLDDRLEGIVYHRSLFDLERGARSALNAYQGNLSRVLSVSDPLDEFLRDVFDVCVDLSGSEAYTSLSRLRELFETIYPSLSQMRNPWLHLDALINQMTMSSPKQTGVMVVTLDEGYIPFKERVYLMGASSEHYPQLSEAKGLFDEAYFRGIQGYDVQAHFTHHMAELTAILHSAPELVVSYYLGNFEGKARKLAVELDLWIKSLNQTAEAWPTHIPLERESSDSFQLNPSTAQALFFNEGVISGSVSSFETYFHCSYQYFLRYGLRLRTKETLSFNQMWMGNLMHKVLELTLKHQHDNYPHALIVEGINELHIRIDALNELFPKKSHELKRIAARTQTNLKLLSEILSAFEEKQAAKRFLLEKPYHIPLKQHPSYGLLIKGKIDRLDITDHGFYLYDYKSSKKNLSERMVHAGLQIQLPTYLWLSRRYLDVGEPLGMGYMSLKQEPIKLRALKHASTELSAVSAMDPDTTWLKEHQPKTWSMSMYDPDKIEHHIDQLFQSMIDALAQGRIEKHHRDKSCVYCDYRSFCQFAKSQEKVLKITKAQGFKRGKDDSD